MNTYVADALPFVIQLWMFATPTRTRSFGTSSPRLGPKAKGAFDEGARGEAVIYIPAIVLAEIYFLNEKLGRPIDFASGMSVLSGSSQFVLVSFNPEDTLDFGKDRAVPEMHDRMIVGVARRLNAICISTDSEIISSGVASTIW